MLPVIPTFPYMLTDEPTKYRPAPEPAMLLLIIVVALMSIRLFEDAYMAPPDVNARCVSEFFEFGITHGRAVIMRVPWLVI
jgi:hypothetical protein